MNPWRKLFFAGAYTFTLAGIVRGAQGSLVARTELPEGTFLPGAVLGILGVVGGDVVVTT